MKMLDLFLFGRQSRSEILVNQSSCDYLAVNQELLAAVAAEQLVGAGHQMALGFLFRNPCLTLERAFDLVQ